jgi:hypothetical protein
MAFEHEDDNEASVEVEEGISVGGIQRRSPGKVEVTYCELEIERRHERFHPRAPYP